MKLKEILSLETSYNQEFIIAYRDKRGDVFQIAAKNHYEDTTKEYLNFEVIKIHATSYGSVVLTVKEPNK